MISQIGHLMGEFAQELCQNQKVVTFFGIHYQKVFLQFDLNYDQIRKVDHFGPDLG
jgi:hypothetical protein